MSGKRTADQDLGHGAVFAAFLNQQRNITVVQQQLFAGFQRFENFLVRQFDTTFVPRLMLHVQHKFLPLFQHNAAVAKLADAKLRPLHIRHQGNMAVLFLREFAHDFKTLFVLGMSAMAEVEAESIAARVD